MWGTGLMLGFAILLGMAFVLIWKRIVAAFAPKGFWDALLKNAFAMIRSDEPMEVIRHYKSLVVLVGRYALANVFGVVLGLTPLFVTLELLSPYAMDPWNRAAPYVEVYPPGAGTLEQSTAEVVHADDSGRAFYRIDKERTGALRIVEGRVELGDLTGRYGVCGSGLYCLLLNLLRFDVHDHVEQAKGLPGYVVIRPSYKDDNVFWPFLNDLEFQFFTAFFVTNVVMFLWAKRSA